MKYAIFDTHGADSELNDRTGERVEVIRPLTKEEADIDDVGKMYKIRFSDGTCRDAFEDELTEISCSNCTYCRDGICKDEACAGCFDDPEHDNFEIKKRDPENPSITKWKARAAQRVLLDNGIDADETGTVLQALGYVMFDEEWENVIEWDKNKIPYKNNIWER